MNETQHISEGDLTAHKRMVQHRDEALALMQQAQQLQEQGQRLMTGFVIWAQDLHTVYSLDTEAGDTITDDGAIFRAPLQASDE